MADGWNEAWQAARAAWPGVLVSLQDYSSYVAEREGNAKTEKSHGSPPKVHGEDLYLACACARGDAAALASFEAAYGPEVDRALLRVGRSAPAPDEVRQLLRHKLFVAEPGAAPKIAEYSGRGSLRGWVRITVMRVVLNLVTRPSPERAFEDEALMVLLGGGADPELEHLKRIYREEFRAGFAEALRAFSSRDRSLLRYAFCEGITVDAIGALYGVHRATAARWVAKAHATLLERVRELVLGRLKIGPEEYASILRLIQSRFDLTLERYLETPAS